MGMTYRSTGCQVYALVTFVSVTSMASKSPLKMNLSNPFFLYLTPATFVSLQVASLPFSTCPLHVTQTFLPHCHRMSTTTFQLGYIQSFPHLHLFHVSKSISQRIHEEKHTMRRQEKRKCILRVMSRCFLWKVMWSVVLHLVGYAWCKGWVFLRHDIWAKVW